jgi:tetratricopeptide (TPR) repeat protein
MNRGEDRSGLFEGKPFARVYHYHIRKCGGTSLNWAFLRLSGQDLKQLYARLSENGLVKAGGIRYVGWRRPLITAGNWDYGFAHAAFHNVNVPANTYTFCVLRDPAARVLSHYKMLLYMREHEPNHACMAREAPWIEAGFDGFLERISRQDLLRQVFMFSRRFDVGEAIQNMGTLNRVMFLDNEFERDFDGLRGDTGLALDYVHERAAKAKFQPTESQQERLYSLLEPEYRLINEMRKRLRPSPASEQDTHESVTMKETPQKENVSADLLENTDRHIHDHAMLTGFAQSESVKSVNVNTGKRFSVPTAVVTYNRPWHTQQVLNALKDQGIQKLYLFSDAPRVQEDKEKVSQVRELLRSVDWADVELVERETNYGLARSVTGAANHVFAKHDRILVLEDDVVPFPGLFPFVEKSLDKYETNPRVTGISGYSIRQPEEIRSRYPFDAYFFPRISSQGWATWKSRWNRFDPDLKRLTERAAQANLDITIGGTDLVRNLSQALNGRDVWTMNWVLSAMLDEGVTLYPTESQIRNVGMDGSGMNSGTTSRFNVDDPTRMPDRIPDEIFIDPDLAATFYSYYDLKGTQRDPSVDRIGPHAVKRLNVNGKGHQIQNDSSFESLDNPDALIETAMNELESGQPVEALAKLDRVLASEGASQNLHLVRGLCLQQLDRFEDALIATRAELASYPDNKDAQAFEQILVKQSGHNGNDGNGNNGTSTPINGPVASPATKTKTTAQSAEPVVQSGSNSDLIVFVSDEPRSREAKLAHGLTRAGKRVVLLHKKAPTFNTDRYFERAFQYNNAQEAVALAKTFQPLVVHAFASRIFDSAMALLNGGVRPLLFDDFDVLAGMIPETHISKRFPGQIEHERVLLERADGIVCRSLETGYAKRHLGYRFGGPRLFFPEYMWGESEVRTTDESDIDALVYVGNLPAPNHADPSTHWLLDVLDRIKASGLPLHVFPAYPRPGLVDYAASQGDGMLVVHERQEPKALQLHLRRYLAGIQFPLSLKRAVEPAYTTNKGRVSISGKMFDYLDAGLPMIVADQLFQRWLLNRYQAAIPLDQAAPLESMARLNVGRLREVRNTLRQTDLSPICLSRQIPRLIEFYYRISRNMKVSSGVERTALEVR